MSNEGMSDAEAIEREKLMRKELSAAVAAQPLGGAPAAITEKALQAYVRDLERLSSIPLVGDLALMQFLKADPKALGAALADGIAVIHKHLLSAASPDLKEAIEQARLMASGPVKGVVTLGPAAKEYTEG